MKSRSKVQVAAMAALVAAALVVSVSGAGAATRRVSTDRVRYDSDTRNEWATIFALKLKAILGRIRYPADEFPTVDQAPVQRMPVSRAPSDN